jgi:hypothetical protein
MFYQPTIYEFLSDPSIWDRSNGGRHPSWAHYRCMRCNKLLIKNEETLCRACDDQHYRYVLDDNPDSFPWYSNDEPQTLGEGLWNVHEFMDAIEDMYAAVRDDAWTLAAFSATEAMEMINELGVGRGNAILNSRPTVFEQYRAADAIEKLARTILDMSKRDYPELMRDFR